MIHDLPPATTSYDLPPGAGSGPVAMATPIPAPAPAAAPVAPQLPASRPMAAPAPGPAVQVAPAAPSQTYAPGYPPPAPNGGYAPAPGDFAPQEIVQEIEGHMLGFSTLLVSVGSLIGIRFGGLYGGVSGALFGGAGVNTFRAVSYSLKGTPVGDKEAVISGTYAFLAAALGGVVLWRSVKKKPTAQTPNKTANVRRTCDIRPIGP